MPQMSQFSLPAVELELECLPALSGRVMSKLTSIKGRRVALKGLDVAHSTSKISAAGFQRVRVWFYQRSSLPRTRSTAEIGYLVISAGKLSPQGLFYWLAWFKTCALGTLNPVISRTKQQCSHCLRVWRRDTRYVLLSLFALIDRFHSKPFRQLREREIVEISSV